jgi:hypothetical protein
MQVGQGSAGGEHCLTLSYLGPSSIPTSCYSALENKLDKLQITIRESFWSPSTALMSLKV